MLVKEIQPYIFQENRSLIDAMKQIDKNATGIVFITDMQNKLVGCLTDGDIRRYIIKNGSLNATARDAMNRAPKYLLQADSGDASVKMRREKVYSVAIVDENMVIQAVAFSDEYISISKNSANGKGSLEGTPVIIMAGGMGTRLYPYTRILPKPLIPIGDVPILERIFNRFCSCGVTEFYLTVNYRKEMIKSYFSESDHPYQIHYVNEEKPMGTAGSIGLIGREFERPVIVTNCDILIEADYAKMMEYHNESGNDITIISSLKNTVIPYGVLHSGAEGRIKSMEEKPTITHLINTGMYVVNPAFLKWIPHDRIFHMTDLVELMIERNRQVGMYPISEDAFLDMGEFEELKRMEERVLKDSNTLQGRLA